MISDSTVLKVLLPASRIKLLRVTANGKEGTSGGTDLALEELTENSQRL